MSCLYDLQTLEFFCSHHTINETSQLSEWADREIKNKLATLSIDRDVERFIGFICTKVILNIKEILNGQEGAANFFVVFYSRLLRLCETDTKNPENRESTEKARMRIIRQISQRNEKRVEFLRQHMNEPKLADFIVWFKANRENADATFNLIVDAFVEQLTQTMLEKGVCKMIFPSKGGVFT